MQLAIDIPNVIGSGSWPLRFMCRSGASHTYQVSLEMFIALSQFTVANQMTEEVKGAFTNRPHLVEDAPGFIRLEVISPLDDPDEIWLMTWWNDEESFRVWH